ncbi:MAG: helix-turn-helix domain-containing protein [Lachnospiraceae bacterium]|nr:helix-turn-helix domain-containing protein [Lachnospiraceae bacterium]
MVSNQVLQKTIDGVSQITRVALAVYDPEGGVLASNVENSKLYVEPSREFAESTAESQMAQGSHFFKVFEEDHLEFVCVAEGDGVDSQMVGKLLKLQLEELLIAYRERFDKDNFFKNLLLDNLLLIDIYNRAKKLRVEYAKKRICMIVETGPSKDGGDIERIHSIIGKRPEDFVTAVDENNVIVIRELDGEEDESAVVPLANKIISIMKSDENRDVRVSYGTVVEELKDVSKSYKEANLALDVGRIFFQEHKVIAYSVLGIGRLIYQLPLPLCKMFIQEIFKGKSPKDFDEETLTTINKFFENSLNVSETSRQLYIHRNTLVYRLDKLQKSTGLDLRIFEDAITFKIALMVVEYMNYMEDHSF